MKNIGKTIIILTFLASLNFYLIIFTVPIFVVGIVLLWISKCKLLTKVLWTILPIILWYPAGFLFTYLSGTIGTATAQRFDFIFPANFEGKVMIIEKMPCGQPKEIVNYREQLFIPSNGILLYQGDLEKGYVNNKYYRIINGQKVEIPERASYMYFDSEQSKPNT